MASARSSPPVTKSQKAATPPPVLTGAESVSLVAGDDIHVDAGFASRTI
jgi:hypothetical protein